MRIKTRKIKVSLKNLPRTLASHPFLGFWLALAVSLLLSGVVFYKYIIIIQKAGIGEYERSLRFHQETYQEVLSQWQEREKKFEEAGLKEYPNPFLEQGEKVLPATSTEEATSTPEEVTPSPKVEKLLATTNLSWFYRIKGEKLPSVQERAIMWEEKGLGSKEEYKGLKYQNMILLARLKKELAP